MDVKNSSGHVVSILNDDHAPRYASFSSSRQNSLPSFLHSRRSSSNSTPALSPTTPFFSRRDSNESATTKSPSPVTPTLSHEPAIARAQVKFNTFDCSRPQILPRTSYQQALSAEAYPITPPGQMAELSLHHHSRLAQQSFFKAQMAPQMNSHDASQFSNHTAPKQATKKNSYPCPIAKQYGCNEFFTTSGHAARHAKKHTGRKDAICPECSKAFTRKDNMEQHRRTHSGVRGAPRSAASMEEVKVKKMKLQQKKARSPSDSAVSTTPLPEWNVLDPRLIESPAVYSPHVTQLPFPVQQQQAQHAAPTASMMNRPLLHRSNYKDELQWRLQPAASITPSPRTYLNTSPELASPSLAPALDALALAASRR